MRVAPAWYMLAAAMLYVLYGSDDFSQREELARIKGELDSDGMLSSSTDVLDGREVSPEQLMAICDTIPFLSAHRLVVVEGLLKRFDPPERPRRGARPARGPSAEALERWLALAEHAQRMPATTTLILVDEELSAKNPLLQALSPVGQVREFRLLRPGAVLQWILERAQSRAIDISPAAARLLADLIGNNLWLLASELEKLAAYAQGRRIEGSDVRALVSEARQVNIFALVDAVVEKRAAVALRLLRQLTAAGAAGGYLLSMVTRQYRLIIQARELMTAGLPTQEIGQRLEITSEFVLQRILGQAQRYSLPRLRTAYRRLLDADVGVKRGHYDEDLALELLVHDLARI
ncbi:MAG: DNA polymerase III subunit delta [Dehalococcoidia bacterium]